VLEPGLDVPFSCSRADEVGSMRAGYRIVVILQTPPVGHVRQAIGRPAQHP
jgi:hypothetical protein